MNNYLIKIASKPQEIEAAQRLRFEVFNLEIKGGIKSTYSNSLDKDKYDPYCDHIIIIDQEKVIGTYRMLLGSKINNVGFYSESKFDLSNIRKLIGPTLELGRSCIHRDYRNKKVLDLLWQGIAEYVFKNNIKYIFGCPSAPIRDPKEAWQIFSYLKKWFYSDEKFRVFPLKEFELPEQKLNPLKEEKTILRSLSPLLQAYLKIGAKICGTPAVNPEFNTTVFFMLLEVDSISNSYKKHFLKSI